MEKLTYCTSERELIVQFNTLRPRQNGRHFPDESFKWIFLNENVWILIEISLKFVPRCPINNIPALVQMMAWCRSGDKPLSEPMMVNFLTHMCVTRPQWLNSAYITWMGMGSRNVTPGHQHSCIMMKASLKASLGFHWGTGYDTLYFLSH